MPKTSAKRLLVWWIVSGMLVLLVVVLAACSTLDTEPDTAAPIDIVPPPSAAELMGYAGSDTCFACHPTKHNDFIVSGSPWKLKTAELASNNPIPVPAGYDWEIISYVIGGNRWSTLYVDDSGYIITSAGDQPGNNQYNLMTGTWSDYRPGEVVPFDCGSCHATGYSSEGNQDGLEGIVGTWALEGVQCEACHGPALKHVQGEGAKKSTVTIDTSDTLCGSCHTSGNDTSVIPAQFGFIEKNGQYNEFLASPHKNYDCVSCHDPHKKAEFSIRVECGSCHQWQKDDFRDSTMDQVGVTCEDCHMPMATLSAQALGPYMGDVKTHLFRINTDPDASMFTDDGAFAQNFVTLDFACLACHQNKDTQWAGDNAEDIHTRGK